MKYTFLLLVSFPESLSHPVLFLFLTEPQTNWPVFAYNPSLQSTKYFEGGKGIVHIFKWKAPS